MTHSRAMALTPLERPALARPSATMKADRLCAIVARQQNVINTPVGPGNSP